MCKLVSCLSTSIVISLSLIFRTTSNTPGADSGDSALAAMLLIAKFHSHASALRVNHAFDCPGRSVSLSSTV